MYPFVQVATRNTPLAPDIKLEEMALSSRADGFSGADLTALVREATTNALSRVRGQLDLLETQIEQKRKHILFEGDKPKHLEVGVKVDVQDFEAAFKKVSYKIATNIRNDLTEHVINHNNMIYSIVCRSYRQCRRKLTRCMSNYSIH